MKKRYSLLFAATIAGWLGAGAVAVPYSSNIGDKSAGAIAADWTIVDNNLDKTTWVYDGTDDNLTAVTGANAGIKYGYNSKNNADDWAISPEFELKAGMEYVISFWMKTSKNQGESLAVYAGTSVNPDNYTDAEQIAVYDKTFDATWRKEQLIFVPAADGAYHIAFKAFSAKNEWGILLRGFSIKANVLTPAAPSDLTATPAPDNALGVDLAWTLPVTDDEGNLLEKPLTAVNILRDGEKIVSLAGDATEYSDTSLPAPGVYEYSVSVELDGVASLPVTCTTKWVGEKTPQELPYYEDFKNQDFVNTFWTCIDVDGDAKTNGNTSYPPLSYAWCFQSNAMKNAWWAVYYTPRNAENDENDWLISAPLNFPGPGRYKVSFKLSMYAGQTLGCRLGLYAGQSPDPEGMTIEIATVEHQWTSAQMNPATDGTLFEYEFETETGGTYYIGVHCNVKATTAERRLHLGAFGCELVEQYASTVIEPPYNSADDEAWQPAESLTFSLSKGYYHAAWATEGQVELTGEAAALDRDFHPAVAVVKVTDDCEATFAADQPFTTFAIIPYDHTPAAPEKCEYTTGQDGSKTFVWESPLTNAAGTNLYEIVGARIECEGQTVAETTDCTPGNKDFITLPVVDEPVVLSDDPDATEPVYTLVLHNLSGESTPLVATADTSGIAGITVGGQDSAPRIYTINGTEVKGDKLPAGLYIEVRDGHARKISVK